VRDIVRTPKATASLIWKTIHDQFRDNELHRAVYLEAEFRNIVQGDMDIAQYTGRLKTLADALRDVGQPVGETSQVLNMLRSISSKYRHAVPAITAKQPSHTFLFARSYLLLEEHYDKEHAKSAAQHTLVTTGGSRPPSTPATDGGSRTGGTAPAARPPLATAPPLNRNDNKRGRDHGRGRGFTNNSASGQPSAPRAPAGWTLGLNPWTGMVQAW
jgi:hypothetical protein